MSVQTRPRNGTEARLQQLEALERMLAVDVQRLWKRIPQGPDSYGERLIAAYPVDPFDDNPIDQSGTLPVSGATGAAGSASATGQGSGGSGGGSGQGITGGTPNVSGGTLQTGGHVTAGTIQTGATVGTGATGGHQTGGTSTGQGTGGTGLPGGQGTGTIESGINTGRSGGGSGGGATGGTSSGGTAMSGTQQSGVCYGPLLTDQFNGISGLQLAFHAPDYDKLGGGWQGDTLELELTGGISNKVTPRDASVATGTHEYRAVVNVGEKNVWLVAEGTSLGNANGGSARYAGLIVRYVSDLDHWILRVNAATDVIEIIEVNAGARTVRASYPVAPGVYGTLPTMQAIVRDQYIRFQFGVYAVSYGAASYLQGAGRHGIYFAHTGTVNSDQEISSIAINCLPADESGTGLSGSRSESHLSGGGATGGTPTTQGTGITAGTTNTGGTPVGSGGTYLTAVAVPSSDVTYTWAPAGPAWTLLNEVTTHPGGAGLDTGTTDRARATDADDNEPLVMGMTDPVSAGTAKRLTLFVYMGGNTASVTVEARISVNGSFLSPAGSNSVSTSPGWHSFNWTGTWDLASGFDPLRIEIKPLSIAKNNSLFVYAAYVLIEYWT
jgi:hypothetical protein